MAIKGLAIPVFGEYSYDGANAKYSGGFVAGSAIEYSIEIDTSDNNPLYGDNKIIENDYGTFSSGTLKLNTSDLDYETSKALLGLKEVSSKIGSATVKELVYDEDVKSTPKGFGVIEEHQINDVDKYRAVILCKVTMSIPEDSATTREDKIDWETKEIEGTITRSDEESVNYKHPWKREAWFDTQAEALSYLKAVLGVSEATDTSNTSSTKSTS